MARFLCKGNTKEDKDEKDITKICKKRAGIMDKRLGIRGIFWFF
jgi:hypothetical protein